MTALRTWVATRVALAVLVLAGMQQVFGGRGDGWLAGWDSWDVTLFRKVAQFGYDGYPRHYPDKDIAAFFPGFPLVLKAFHAAIPSWTAAGLLVSFVAGAVAVVYLSKLAELEGVDGSVAVLALLLSPYAVFLAVGYSESLFLALAVPGWYAARRGRWEAAALLVAGSCLVRVSGLFLAIGLLVLWATTSRERRVLPFLAAPFLALFGFVAYLHHLSGDWLRWQHAQSEGWGRHFTGPVAALRGTWDAAHQAGMSAEFRWSYYAQIACVAVGLVVVAVSLARREWGEATYVGLSVAALATSTVYLSIERATLLWFPLWVLLARWASGRPWLQWGYLALATPLMVTGVLTFHDGRWVG
ncbi:MAG: mannosyltransferase family protein [Mycobacteriales bacterium]